MIDIELLPANVEAEQVSLGCILLDNGVAPQALYELAPSDYSVPRHRYVFDAMRSLDSKGRAIDPLTLREELLLSGHAEECDPLFIHSLLDGCPRFSNIVERVRQIKDASIKRQSVHLARWLAGEATAKDVAADDLLNRLAAKVEGLQESKIVDDLIDSEMAVTRAMGMLRERWNAGTQMIGLPSGFPDLDKVLLGFRPRKYYVLAAPTGQGKTTLALNFANYILFESPKDDRRVGLVISLEMGTDELVVKSISTRTRIDSYRIETGDLSAEEKDLVDIAAGELSALPLEYVEGFSRVTANSLIARVSKIRRKYGRLDFVIVDYLQLLDSDEKKENEHLKLSEISRTLKRISLLHHLPVIVLSQLNRSHDKRTGDSKDLQLSDLRGSGSIEQDADVVLFLMPAKDSEGDDDPRRRLVVAKHRGGKKNVTIDLVFFGDQSRFESAFRDPLYRRQEADRSNSQPQNNNRSNGSSRKMSAEEKRAWMAEYEEGVMP